MIQALHSRVEVAQTVEAYAALAGMDGLAERGRAVEIELVDVDRTLGRTSDQAVSGAKWETAAGEARKGGANLLREQHLDEVTGFAALDQAQSAAVEEAMDGGTSGAIRDANAAGEPSDGEMEAALAFEMAMAEEEGVDGTVENVQSQIRDDEVVEMFPHHCAVGHFAFHG
jgi:hypothetical protein